MDWGNLQEVLRQLAQKGSESPYDTPAPPRFRDRNKRIKISSSSEEFQVPVQLSLFQNL